MKIIVKFHWDEETEVWVAMCDELGILLEQGSYDALIEKVEIAVPEMIECNKLTEPLAITVRTSDRQIICI